MPDITARYVQRRFLIGVGLVFLLLGVAGLIFQGAAGITFKGVQSVLYIVVGAVSLWSGYRRWDIRFVTKFFGILFTVLGLVGIVSPQVLGFIYIDTGVAANILHLLVGLWGLWLYFVEPQEMRLPIKKRRL